MPAARDLNRILEALKWIVRDPRKAGRLLAALERSDGAVLAQLLDDAVVRDAMPVLMAREEVLEARFERDGTVWRTDFGDEIGRSLWRTGSYEGLEIEAVTAWMAQARPTHQSKWVVDAGANIGTTTIPFARKGYRVLAVEPVPTTFALLRANVDDNGYSQDVVCVNSAITPDAGTIEMWTGSGSGQAEISIDGHRPAMERWGTRGTRITVEASPLSVLLSDSSISPEDVALVWADIQGAETGLIDSATELWLSGVPLYLEVDPTSLDLKAGIAAFRATVVKHFSSFYSRDDLVGGGASRPIEDFDGWLFAIGRDEYSDALLVP